MKLKQAYFLLSILIQMFVITSLMTGSPLLTTPIIKGSTLPWGNIMTWTLFVLFPVNFLVIRKRRRLHLIPRRFFNTTVILSLLMGVLWLFVSYILSGNWQFSFSAKDTNQSIWQAYTYLTPTLPFIGYLGMRALSVFFKP